jgi:hypothetical protein
VPVSSKALPFPRQKNPKNRLMAPQRLGAVAPSQLTMARLI